MAMSARGWPSRGRCAQRSRQLAWPGGWSRRSIRPLPRRPGDARQCARRGSQPQRPLWLAPARSAGGTYYAGPRAMSEPETRAIVGLTRRVRPTVAVWFHQHARLVDLSRGDRRIIRRYGRRVGLPAINYGTRPGSLTTWQAAAQPQSTPFVVVELPAGPLPQPRCAHTWRRSESWWRGRPSPPRRQPPRNRPTTQKAPRERGFRRCR